MEPLPESVPPRACLAICAQVFDQNRGGDRNALRCHWKCAIRLQRLRAPARQRRAPFLSVSSRPKRLTRRERSWDVAFENWKRMRAVRSSRAEADGLCLLPHVERCDILPVIRDSDSRRDDQVRRQNIAVRLLNEKDARRSAPLFNGRCSRFLRHKAV
jgi:hypothetical protein